MTFNVDFRKTSSSRVGRFPINHRRVQTILLIAMGLFIVFLVAMILYRSSARRGLLPGGEGAGLRGALRDVVKAESALSIQQFSRKQTKDGKVIWSVKARDASYYPQFDLAHVNDVEITLHRQDGAPCIIHSSAGKLYLAGENLKRAEFEGDVSFATNDGSLTVRTEIAQYLTESDMIQIPGAVKIFGPGYAIDAVGMSMLVDNQVIDLLNQVNSRFEPEARVPSDLTSAAQNSRGRATVAPEVPTTGRSAGPSALSSTAATPSANKPKISKGAEQKKQPQVKRPAQKAQGNNKKKQAKKQGKKPTKSKKGEI